MTLLAPNPSVELALFILIGLVLLKYSGLLNKIMKGIGFFVAGIFFLFLDAATSIGFWALPSLAQAQYGLGILWEVIAWILFLIGAFLIASDLISTK